MLSSVAVNRGAQFMQLRVSSGPFSCGHCIRAVSLPIRRCLVVTKAKEGTKWDGGIRSREDAVTLRSEAEAPFRSIRLVLFGFSAVSAGIGFLISLPQLAAALSHADRALELNDVLTNIAIDLGAVGVFAFLLSRDWRAREQQIARLTREESLAALPIQLANRKRTTLGALRGAARPVLVAGSVAQVEAAVQAAGPFREELQRRGVLLITLPIFEDKSTAGSPSPGEASAAVGSSSDSSSLSPTHDLRWRATALQPEAWRDWFTTQLKFTKTGTRSADGGLYVGLRMDGRVRASGTGRPPWARFAAELAPVEGDGTWSGFFDGFDGRV